MKKIFSIIGFITIICMSYIISNKTTTVVKDIDTLLTELKSQSKKYEQQPINAKIKNNTIIPGLYGKKINIDKTYKELKKIGMINEKYFIYDEIKPEISIEKQYNKYIISGNPEKKMISIIILVQEDDNISRILEIIEKNEIKVNFFIDDEWLKNNQEQFNEIIKKGQFINNNNFKIQNYCYTEEENPKILESCKEQKKYTIKPEIIISNNPLKELKKKIKSGSIISLSINETTEKELELMVNYINTKGYKIETLSNHLSEKNITKENKN